MQKLRVGVVARLMVVVALAGAGTGWAQTFETVSRPAGWVERAIDREVSRLDRSASGAGSVLQAVPQPQKRSWIGRHPVLFGALVGFGGGFLVGYLPGDDAVFDDFTAGFNGMVLGGVGALAGGIIGAVAN